MKKVLGQDMVVGRIYFSQNKVLIGRLVYKHYGSDILLFRTINTYWAVNSRGLAPFPLMDMEFYEHDDLDNITVDN